MIDVSKMKAFLLKEYEEAGFTHAEEFVRGMTWLETLWMDQLNKEERLNDWVQDNRDNTIQRLQKRVDKLETEKEEMTATIERLRRNKNQSPKVQRDRTIKRQKETISRLINEMQCKRIPVL